MTKEKKEVGLVLGKFAPYHKGHASVIQKAVDECKHVYVLVYESDVTCIPLAIRASWIRESWSPLAVTVIAGWNSPQDEGYTPKVMRTQERYVKGVLKAAGVKKIHRFYSSEPYGAHMSRALGAKDIRVDMDRSKHAISGTAIRANPYKHRKMLSPKVYEMFVTKVLLLGAPSTGKTTLAKALAKKYKTQWLPEYGREYWEKHQHDHRLSMMDLLNIQAGHKERLPKVVGKSNKYLFVDTAEITTALFGVYYSGGAIPWSMGTTARPPAGPYDLEKLVLAAKASMSQYDIVIVCDQDIPFEASADRSGPASRPLMQRMTSDTLNAWGIQCFMVSGPSLKERVEQVDDILFWYKNGGASVRYSLSEAAGMSYRSAL